MSIFEHRKPSDHEIKSDPLDKLRSTLERLSADPEETPGVADLKRILTARIAEMERKSV